MRLYSPSEGALSDWELHNLGSGGGVSLRTTFTFPLQRHLNAVIFEHFVRVRRDWQTLRV